MKKLYKLLPVIFVLTLVSCNDSTSLQDELLKDNIINNLNNKPGFTLDYTGVHSISNQYGLPLYKDEKGFSSLLNKDNRHIVANNCYEVNVAGKSLYAFNNEKYYHDAKLNETILPAYTKSNKFVKYNLTISQKVIFSRNDSIYSQLFSKEDAKVDKNIFYADAYLLRPNSNEINESFYLISFEDSNILLANDIFLPKVLTSATFVDDQCNVAYLDTNTLLVEDPNHIRKTYTTLVKDNKPTIKIEEYKKEEISTKLPVEGSVMLTTTYYKNENAKITYRYVLKEAKDNYDLIFFGIKCKSYACITFEDIRYTKVINHPSYFPLNSKLSKDKRNVILLVNKVLPDKTLSEETYSLVVDSAGNESSLSKDVRIFNRNTYAYLFKGKKIEFKEGETICELNNDYYLTQDTNNYYLVNSNSSIEIPINEYLNYGIYNSSPYFYNLHTKQIAFYDYKNFDEVKKFSFNKMLNENYPLFLMNNKLYLGDEVFKFKGYQNIDVTSLRESNVSFNHNFNKENFSILSSFRISDFVYSRINEK